MVFLILLAVFVPACLQIGKPDTAIKKVDLSNQEDVLVIPSSLWRAFEAAYPELTAYSESKKEDAEKSEKPKQEKKALKKEDSEIFKRRPSIDPLVLTASLMEKTSGVLGGRNYEFSFGKGGGTVDFKDYVNENKNGSFFMKMKYESEMDSKLTKVFYFSNSPKQASTGFGSGCNKYFEVTSAWPRIMKGDGILLNTMGFRHIALMAGTFFFVSPFKGKLRMGHLTFKDSHHPELLCNPEMRN